MGHAGAIVVDLMILLKLKQIMRECGIRCRILQLRLVKVKEVLG
jgi:hypothetical protein